MRGAVTGLMSMGSRSNKRRQAPRSSRDHFARDTERELELSTTPDHARVYVAPRTIPRVTEHETVETETIAVQPRVDRRARTVPSLARRHQGAVGRSRLASELALVALPILVGVVTALLFVAMAGNHNAGPPASNEPAPGHR